MTETRNRSPRIKHVSWGQLEVEGRAEPYKDAKLFPGGSREWNWRDTGMAHRPGIQIADVQELLDHGAKIIVLSRGMAECLQVQRDAGFFENGGGCRARVADQRSRSALQQAGRKRGRRRTLSYDVLIRSAANGRARHSVLQKTWKNNRAVIRSKI